MTRYWWVSQNQTFNHEVGGGYMWAPKTARNGSIPQSYLNMTEVQPGDIIFSFAGQQIKAVGVALSGAIDSDKPQSFGKAGESWTNSGWRVDVMYTAATTPIFPREHMNVLTDLLPGRHSPLRPEGIGNQAYLFEIDGALATTLLGLTNTTVPSMPAFSLADLQFDPEEQELIAQTSLDITQKTTLILARRGQGMFRSRVQVIEPSCRVTGVASDKFLVASHIKPWRNSSDAERLDGNNGLFLSPHVDRLFDGGFITFTQRGDMEVSPMLDEDVLAKWHIDPSRNYRRFNDDQAHFLEYHNEVLFQAA